MILGLTGGIGSGKSTVAEIFRVLGHPVFEADQAGRKVLDADPEVIESVEALFGQDVYIQGKADRKRIASIVFSDPAKLDQLNAIIHPAVGRAWKKWVSEQGDYRLLIREVAILFESGSDKLCDKVLTVSAPEPLRIERVMGRDAVTGSEVRARMARQWTDVQRRERADFEILNDGRKALIPQVLEVLSALNLS